MLRQLMLSELKMFFRNRQLMFWTLFLPVFVIIVLGMIFNQPIQQMGYTIAVVDYDHSDITQNSTSELSNVSRLTVNSYDDLALGIDALKKGEVDLIVVYPSGTGKIVQDHINGRNLTKAATIDLYYLNSDRTKIDIAINTVYRIVAELNIRIHDTPICVRVEENALTLSGVKKDIRYIDYFVPGIISLSLMNVGIYSTISLISSMKEKQVLRRLSITPLKQPVFILSLFLTRLVISLLCMTLILIIAIGIFSVQIAGSLPAIILVILVGTTVFVLLGLAISGYARSSSSAEMMANTVSLPMIFISNAFIPIQFLPPSVSLVSKFVPLTYISEPIRSLAFFNLGLTDICVPLGILSIWAVLFFILAVVLFKWE